MTSIHNPVLSAFLQSLDAPLEFAQVLVSRRGTAFELRHVADASVSDSALELIEPDALLALSNHTEYGAFRPLKSAPTLRSGWRAMLVSPSGLELALGYLYPGALADWYAQRAGKADGITYRDHVHRQTGMYRITQMLSDEQVAELAQAGCDRRFCLKQRRWHGPALTPENNPEKSIIPCLEPCPMLLEFARKSMRLEQGDHVSVNLPTGDLETLIAAVDAGLTAPDEGGREADFSAANNRRRLLRTKILLERWLAQAPRKEDKE